MYIYEKKLENRKEVNQKRFIPQLFRKMIGRDKPTKEIVPNEKVIDNTPPKRRKFIPSSQKYDCIVHPTKGSLHFKKCSSPPNSARPRNVGGPNCRRTAHLWLVKT